MANKDTTGRDPSARDRAPRTADGAPVEAPAETPAATPRTTPRTVAEPHTGDTRHFQGTITKIDKNGREVLSDTLEAGETLRSQTTGRYNP